MLNSINELFAPPIGLHRIPIFGNLKLYTSNHIRNSFLKSMYKTNKMKPIIESLTRLVNNNIVVPCFLTKGIVSTILYRLHPTDRIRSEEQYFREEFRQVFGFYEIDSNKIYILISNSINKYGFVDNNLLSEILVHETMHMFAANHPDKFISIFRKKLFDFYYFYFQDTFKLKGVFDLEIESIIKFLFEKVEKEKNIDNKILTKYHKKLMSLKSYSTLDSKAFDTLANQYIVLIKLFTKSVSIFIKNISTFSHILSSIDRSYKNVFGGIDVKNVAVQELLFPSEVISVYSEIPGADMADVYKVFKLLS